MDKRKIEAYDDGYSHSGVVLKAAAAASALLLCGSLSACHRIKSQMDNSIMGKEQYIPAVSDSDSSSDDELSLDGEERYYPTEDDTSSESYMGDLTVEPSDGE